MESEQTSVLRPLILVAEDDDSNFKLIKAIIGKKCDIEWAKNGEEMVQLFQEHQHRASAILMDIKMPLMNGLEATRCIRAFEGKGPGEGTPIIAMTANVFADDVKACLDAGMNSHVGKPLDMKVLIGEILKYTDAR